MSSTNSIDIPFKESTPFEKRIQLSSKIRSTYPDRIPVIVERPPGVSVPAIAKKKFLVPEDIHFAKFIAEVRKQIDLSPEESIFLFVHNNVMPEPAAIMSQIYERYKDDDGFTYFTLSLESVFGWSR